MFELRKLNKQFYRSFISLIGFYNLRETTFFKLQDKEMENKTEKKIWETRRYESFSIQYVCATYVNTIYG